MIVRNEEEILEQAVTSTRGLADEIVVLDTGSTDGTAALAENLGCRILNGGDRMHKAESRNRAINAAQGDWIVILDADERIADPAGLRAFLERTDAQAVYIRLAYMDGDDNPTLTYQQMRIWRAGAYRYKYRAHELPVPVNGWGKLAHTDFVWEHRPPRGRAWKLGYTLERLKLDVEENPGEARPLYYLGRQYRYCKEWDEAIDTLTQYLSFSGHDEADAWHDLALCYAQTGQQEEQIKALHQACASQPERREWWCELASLYHDRGRDHEAAGLLKCALELPDPAGTYHNHYWYGSAIYDLLARCLWKLRRYEEGHQHARQALDLKPDDRRLRDNLRWFEDRLNLPTNPDPVRIFITGCAKSGTTLLKRLFYAFEDVDICPDERHIVHFFEQPARAQVLVGKRHRFSLFSEHLSDEVMEHQAELIRAHGVKVINIIRDGRDVIYSDHNNVSPRRWVAAMRQRGKFADLIDMEISYEDLVRRPDDVQQQVAENLGLSIKYRWSDYPTFVPDEEFTMISGVTYTKRPLDNKSVGKGLPYRDIISDTVSAFDQELENARYQNVKGAVNA